MPLLRFTTVCINLMFLFLFFDLAIMSVRYNNFLAIIDAIIFLLLSAMGTLSIEIDKKG